MSGGSTVIHPDVSLWDAWTPERVGELLKDVEATPLAEVGATLQTHQTWVREPGTGRWRLDVFREPSEGDTWICRRDERVGFPYDRVIEWTPEGIPYGRPEIVLLYKAGRAELPKNEDDFAAVLPRLDGARQRWLAEALALVHPGHAWLDRIEGDAQ